MNSAQSRVAQYFGKMSGGATPGSRFTFRESTVSGVGGLIGIGLCSWLSVVSGYPWLTAPFGATSVLIFAAYKTPLAQPRHVVGGYLVSAMAGLVVQTLFGSAWWALAVGVGLAIFGMAISRTLHAPAGGVPIVIMTSHAGWLFLLTPAFIGSATMVLVAVLYNNLFQNRRYPEYWW